MKIIFTKWDIEKIFLQQCILLFAVLIFNNCSAQSVTIYACLDSAENTMPLLKQQPLLQQQLQNELRNYADLYLPVFTANGQASYQSDVPQLPFKIPNFGGLDIPKDQYRVWLEVNQPIYDAGYSQAQKKSAEAATAASLQQLQVSLNENKKQVINTYFQILLATQQSDILSQTISLLQQKENVVEVAYKNGIQQQNDVLEIKAEIISQQKNKAKLDNIIISGKKILSLLTGIDLQNKNLLAPQIAESNYTDLSRNPELELLNAQKKNIAASQHLFESKRLPRISFFGQAGIGSPDPYDFFKSETSTFYMAGIRAKWAIFDWGKSARQINNIVLQQKMLDDQQQQKLIEINSRVTQLSEENNYLNNMLLKDDTLYLLKKQISENASHQLDQGIITSTEYLDDLLAAQQAIMQQNIDQINLYKNRLLLQLETGTLKK